MYGHRVNARRAVEAAGDWSVDELAERLEELREQLIDPPLVGPGPLSPDRASRTISMLRAALELRARLNHLPPPDPAPAPAADPAPPRPPRPSLPIEVCAELLAAGSEGERVKLASLPGRRADQDERQTSHGEARI